MVWPHYTTAPATVQMTGAGAEVMAAASEVTVATAETVVATSTVTVAKVQAAPAVLYCKHEHGGNIAQAAARRRAGGPAGGAGGRGLTLGGVYSAADSRV